jgi:hypothetical protein
MQSTSVIDGKVKMRGKKERGMRKERKNRGKNK